MRHGSWVWRALAVAVVGVFLLSGGCSSAGGGMKRAQQGPSGESGEALAQEESEPAGEEASGWTPFQFSLWHPVQIFGENTDVYGLRTTLFYGKNRDVYGLDLGLFCPNARNVYGLSVLGLGNEFYHGIWPTGEEWHHTPAETGNIHGVQIGLGEAWFAGIMFPYPPYLLGYWGLITTHARNINGLQCALIRGSCHSLDGVQLSGINNHAEEDAEGLQMVLFGINEVDGDCTGLQLGGVCVANSVGGKMSGIQLGTIGNYSEGVSGAQLAAAFNMTGEDSGGLQLSVCNAAREGMKGLQFGLVNYSHRMSGLQLGVVNIIPEAAVPVLPGINFSQTF